MSIRIEKVKTDSFEMKYFKFGAGEKIAVILPGLSVKSITGSADSVASAYRSMHSDYTIYVFDRRAVCPEGYTMLDMADDTAEAMDIIGIKNACVFGVSQGGMIAQCIALSRPNLVRKLALCSTVSRITEENSRVIEDWLRLAELRDEEALNKSICESVYSDSFCEKYGRFITQMMSGANEDDVNRFIILAKSCRGFDISGEIERISCPVFVVGTKKDKIFSVNESLLIAEKTNARLYVYDDYGHAVYDEAPDFLERLKDFFDE